MDNAVALVKPGGKGHRSTEQGNGLGDIRNGLLARLNRRAMRGVAAVEFALVLPLLIVLLLGIIDFGLMMYDKAMITNAAREGARAGIVLRNPRLDESGIRQAAQDYCGNMVITLIGNSQCQIQVTFPDGTRNFSDRLQVDVDFTYEGPVMSVIALLGGNAILPISMRSTAVMRHE